MITDASPNQFGYPSQILMQTQEKLEYLQNPKNKIKVLYYAYQVPRASAGNPPSKRYLVFSLESEKSYIGVEFTSIGWPRYSTILDEVILDDNLKEIQDMFQIDHFDKSFPLYYSNCHQILLDDPEFQSLVKRRFKSTRKQDKLKTKRKIHKRPKKPTTQIYGINVDEFEEFDLKQRVNKNNKIRSKPVPEPVRQRASKKKSSSDILSFDGYQKQMEILVQAGVLQQSDVPSYKQFTSNINKGRDKPKVQKPPPPTPPKPKPKQ